LIISFKLNYFQLLQNFSSANEVSNSIKIGFLKDYIDIFSDFSNLLFGQGLGAYYFWESRGYSFYITELTYLELIRNFGLFFGLFFISLLFFPFFYGRGERNKPFLIGYAFYLFIAIFNPLIFSSVGLIFLAPLITNCFLDKSKNEHSNFGK
jgi:hypothetical protein